MFTYAKSISAWVNCVAETFLTSKLLTFCQPFIKTLFTAGYNPFFTKVQLKKKRFFQISSNIVSQYVPKKGAFGMNIISFKC